MAEISLEGHAVVHTHVFLGPPPEEEQEDEVEQEDDTEEE